LNDDTVRRRDNITGFGSGVKVAGKVRQTSSDSTSTSVASHLTNTQEFTLSLYEGITGLVTQPYRGAEKEGVKGFGKGIGKGLGGLVFKSGAAAFAIPGYTLKGIERQFEKRFDRCLKANLLMTRMKQGIAEYKTASEEDKQLIVKRYEELGSSA